MLNTLVQKACTAAKIPQLRVGVVKGLVAGDFSWKNYQVRINPQLEGQELIETVIHEVAHAVDYKRHGHRKNARGNYISHDTLFRNIMREIANVMGETVTCATTHDLELKPARKMRQWKYNCGCVLEDGSPKGIVVSTVIHNRIQKKGQTRGCRTCGSWFKKDNFIKEVT